MVHMNHINRYNNNTNNEHWDDDDTRRVGCSEILVAKDDGVGRCHCRASQQRLPVPKITVARLRPTMTMTPRGCSNESILSSSSSSSSSTSSDNDNSYRCSTRRIMTRDNNHDNPFHDGEQERNDDNVEEEAWQGRGGDINVSTACTTLALSSSKDKQCYTKQGSRRRRPLLSGGSGSSRSNVIAFLRFVLLLVVCGNALVAVDAVDDTYIEDTLEEYGQQKYAIVFPFFLLSLGVVISWCLHRFRIDHILPYAAIMFSVGIAMGVGTIKTQSHDALSISILQWSQINSDVLLSVFLPGLIFREALGVNFNLFLKSFWQIMILAYPMVLIGTGLTAVVGTYVLPFGWPLSVSATLGAILSSTDPVAVAAVLQQGGATPRLQMHISGESLLNDGSAYVFYVLFREITYSQYGYGESVGIAEGIKKFCEITLGGLAVGLAFAFVLVVILYELDHRLEPEYNVLQVVAALSTAYLCYFVAGVLLPWSGIVACTACGVVSCYLGKGLINDEKLMDTYLGLMESALNTLLFALGGVVWGVVVCSEDRQGLTIAETWYWLFVLYILVGMIRFISVCLVYPVFSRIGLQSDWKEAIFLSHAGFRGSVGIALAVSMYQEILSVTSSPEIQSTASLFEFMTGGISLLSLVVNGITAGPLLKLLGLGKQKTGKNQANHLFMVSVEDFVLQEFKQVSRQSCFKNIKPSVVEAHVPFLKVSDDILAEIRASNRKKHRRGHSSVSHGEHTVVSRPERTPSEDVVEIRQLFLELLSEAYENMLRKHELDDRELGGFNFDALKQSVAFAASKSVEALNDWEYTNMFTFHRDAQALLHTRLSARNLSTGSVTSFQLDHQELRVQVLRDTCFIEGHRLAEAKLQKYCRRACATAGSEADVMQRNVDAVLAESQMQVMEADYRLQEVPEETLVLILSHQVATILYQRLIDFVEQNAEDGVIDRNDAHKLLDNLDRGLHNNQCCTGGCVEGHGQGLSGSCAVKDGSTQKSTKTDNIGATEIMADENIIPEDLVEEDSIKEMDDFENSVDEEACSPANATESDSRSDKESET